LSDASSFLSKFGGTPDVPSESFPAPTGNPLDSFLSKFSVLTESYWFYKETIELRFNTDEHIYYRVGELGELVEQYGVTTVLKRAIDKSQMLTPWAAKMMFEKMLRLIPTLMRTSLDEQKRDVITIYVPEMTLEAFTKLLLEAKSAHRDKLEEAGDIGSLAHKCLEVSIQFAIDNDPDKIVRELKETPTDEKAAACAVAAFAWMQAHNVRWQKTEQKIYSRLYEYAGTMDGLATVDSCEDPSCCNERFKDRLSLIDWKSSNALRLEYLFQTASYVMAEMEEYEIEIADRWILRLGKNEDEAGKFEPWHATSVDLADDFAGYLACLRLVQLLDKVEARMSLQKRGVREAKKQMKAVQKELDKAAAKVKRAEERAQKKLERAAEKERIKADAKRAREEAKLAKNNPAVQELQEVQRVAQAEVQVPTVLRQVDLSESGSVEFRPHQVDMEG